jgi:hypothetical protein
MNLQVEPDIKRTKIDKKDSKTRKKATNAFHIQNPLYSFNFLLQNIDCLSILETMWLICHNSASCLRYRHQQLCAAR